MHFADALTERIARTSPVCVGLDPVLEKLPEGLPQTPEGVLRFCQGIVEVTAHLAACVKPNLAFFEVLGWEGMKIFWELCAFAKEQGYIVIADGKRSDIPHTAAHYADAYLHRGSPIDALTISPYLGFDSITPFIERSRENEKGIFVLVKTSNPSSMELQDLPVGDEVVHEHLAQLVEGWATTDPVGTQRAAPLLGPTTNLSCVGAVVGATYPEEMKYLRTLMPHCPFLIPGVGAQGGRIEDVRHGFLPDGTGAIVSSSQNILYRSRSADWQEAAQRATEELATALRSKS
jgi:orotidine-5'-phosphate decarboxylase